MLLVGLPVLPRRSEGLKAELRTAPDPTSSRCGEHRPPPLRSADTPLSFLTSSFLASTLKTSPMDLQHSPPRAANALSPASAAREPKLQLPPTTDPPGPNNPPKQLV